MAEQSRDHTLGAMAARSHGNAVLQSRDHTVTWLQGRVVARSRGYTAPQFRIPVVPWPRGHVITRSHGHVMALSVLGLRDHAVPRLGDRMASRSRDRRVT